jgi:hypothetical protein
MKKQENACQIISGSYKQNPHIDAGLPPNSPGMSVIKRNPGAGMQTAFAAQRTCAIVK